MAESPDVEGLGTPLVRHLEARDQLSDEERRVLADCVAQTRDIAPHRDLAREGDEPGECRILIEGFAYRYRLLADGRRQISLFHLPGDFVDLHGFLLKRLDHAIAAAGPCRVGIVPHECLTRITENHPHLTRLLWLSTVVDGAIHREWLAAMGRRSALGNMAHLFCEIFVRLQAVGLAQDHSFRFPVTQAELADAMGLSTVHVNRIAQELRGGGLITWQGRTITIANWERLKAIAEFDPTFLNLAHRAR
jgi:CRP-like cAMP-binding protein